MELLWRGLRGQLRTLDLMGKSPELHQLIRHVGAEEWEKLRRAAKEPKYCRSWASDMALELNKRRHSAEEKIPNMVVLGDPQHNTPEFAWEFLLEGSLEEIQQVVVLLVSFCLPQA